MKVGCLGFCLCICCDLAIAGEPFQPDRLQHDPFQKPAIPEKKSTEPAAGNSVPVEGKTPKLIATLLAGNHSMANVNGKIIKLGETVNGYTLVRVEARRALFEKNKKRAYLSIDDHTNEEHDAAK
jgi:hypothetical protein